MFDFQKLDIYHRAKSFSKEVINLIAKNHFDKVTKDQLRRASFSIMLNIAEGSSRFTNRDRRHFVVIARGSIFECVAILEYLSEVEEISQREYEKFYSELEELSRMMYALIKKLEK